MLLKIIQLLTSETLSLKSHPTILLEVKMKPSVITALLSICTVVYAQEWALQFYSDFGCPSGSTSDLESNAGDVGVACRALDTPWPSASQTVNDGEFGCEAFVYQNTDCSDVGCQAFGECCSSNDESHSWNAWKVTCEGA